MSSLGNLFGGSFSQQSATDSNDALKYSAPKEPKAKSNKPSVSEAKTQQVTAAPTAPVGASKIVTPKTIGPSKIMHSAAVRLYKINSTTSAYEAVENGSPLGCVVMGMGDTFQILIYNGQKVPQATVPILSSFDYTVQGLYMSFTDASGSSWSILFDSQDVMCSFIRVVVATSIHMATHKESVEQTTMKRVLPNPNPVAANEIDETTLSIGSMAAGVYLKVWEIGDIADYPIDIINGLTLKQTSPPDEVMKVKMNPADEAIGGLCNLLVGGKKGDKYIFGISPKVFYSAGETVGNFIEANERKFPGSWLMIELEIVKIKSGDKKQKAPTSVTPTNVDVKPIIPASTNQSSPVASVTNDNNNDSTLSRVAKMSGSGGALANIMNNNNNNGYNNNGNNMNDSNSNNNSNNYNNNQFNNNSNNNINNFDRNNNNNQSNQSYNDNTALTIVEGQASRSYYFDSNDTSNNYNNSNNNNRYNNNHNNNNNQQQQNYNNYNQSLSSQLETQSNPQTNQQLTQMNQSMMMVQQSILSIHTKLDQMNSQMTNNHLQNNQQLSLLSSNNNHMNNPMALGMMNMNMNPMMYPTMNNNQMYGLNPNSINNNNQVNPYLQSNINNINNNNSSAVKVKSDELVNTLQFIVAEYDKACQQGINNKNNNTDIYNEQINSLKSTVAKLEEKNELLQARNEKLMTEKSNLLEKQSEIIQSGSTISNKLFMIQAELDNTKKENINLLNEIEESKKKMQQNNNSSELISQLQMQLMTTQSQLAIKEQEHNFEKEMELLSNQTSFNQQIEQLKYDHSIQINELKSNIEILTTEISNQPLPSNEIDLNSIEVRNYVNSVKLSAVNEALVPLNNELDSVKDQLGNVMIELNNSQNNSIELKKINSGLMDQINQLKETQYQQIEQYKNTINDLNLQLDASNNALEVANASSSSLNSEDLKSLMQDIYVAACDMYSVENEEDDNIYHAKDVVKRLKAVLKK
eukprot:gene12106-16203_t